MTTNLSYCYYVILLSKTWSSVLVLLSSVHRPKYYLSCSAERKNVDPFTSIVKRDHLTLHRKQSRKCDGISKEQGIQGRQIIINVELTHTHVRYPQSYMQNFNMDLGIENRNMNRKTNQYNKRRLLIVTSEKYLMILQLTEGCQYKLYV